MTTPTFWNTIETLVSPVPPVVLEAEQQCKKGELVIVGTGIASVRQMTIEALDYIMQADMVFYLVLDLATEAFIQAHAKKSENLHQYYGTEKPRIRTYTQMAEVMLNSVRGGKLTVGVMYGHPGVFVNPSHRAIDIARHEGYEAKMLPGVSAEDCLYADLGIDPSTTGCSMFEATFLLFEKDRIDTRNHLIIWQPGAIGKSAMIFDNEHVHKLADYLEPLYGPDFPVFSYVAAMRPLEKFKLEKITIKDLRDNAVIKRIGLNPCTTFYLPPKTLPPINRGKGSPWEGTLPRVTEAKNDELPTAQALLRTSAYRMSHPEMSVAPLYTKRELEACEELKNFVPPESEKPLSASPALRRVAMKVALLHHRFQRLDRDQIAEIAASDPDLTKDERERLLHYVENIESILKGTPFSRIPPLPVPSVNTFAQAEDVVDEVADIFEAVIEENEHHVTGKGLQLVALVR
ncbi:unnamed protein product [Cercospora beticola]|nr:unnamed protein product [Cercospora beticola]